MWKLLRQLLGISTAPAVEEPATPCVAAPPVEVTVATSEVLFLVSCVSRKGEQPVAARELYTSDWFRKARAHVEHKQASWFILSAEYGLVHPDEVIGPYDRTLNTMVSADRRAWAERVASQLRSRVGQPARIVVFAGMRYREHLMDVLQSLAPTVEVPLEGYRIGEQLRWFKEQVASPKAVDMPIQGRLEHIVEFYRLLDLLTERLGGARYLRDCSGKTGWPQRGVYFFYEQGECRSTTGDGPRLVRIGTHALKAGSKASLWQRLSQHRGALNTGSGNHRGSIFRLVVGAALLQRADLAPVDSWGVASSAGKAATSLGLSREELRAAEVPVEQAVSAIIGDMPFVWLNVGDEAGPESLRGLIERNTIALLSSYKRAPIDPPSAQWLGHHTGREKMSQSGLWNARHVDQDYDPAFLNMMAQFIEQMG